MNQWLNRYGILVGFLTFVVLANALSSCSDEELSEMTLTYCWEDCVCEDGVCQVEEEDVITGDVLARASQTHEGSRHGEQGVFLFSSWELDNTWIELELDIPVDGQDEVDFRLEELLDGTSQFEAAHGRGRIVLISKPGGGLPYVGHFELRFENEDGLVRRLHQVHLQPENDDTIIDPGPVAIPIDWEIDEIEVIVLESQATGEGVAPPHRGPEHGYDYEYEEVGCTCTETSTSCSGDTYDDDASCSGSDSSGSCEGDDDSGGGSSCEGDDDSGGGSSCEGDDDSGGGSSCEGDDYDSSGSSCEGDDTSGGDWSCEGDSSSGSGGSCSGCDGDAYASQSEMTRESIIARARGQRPKRLPVQRAMSFFPIIIALTISRFLARKP